MADNYSMNLDDERFREVEADKKAALTENEKLYSGMVNESDKFYQAQVDASKQWEQTQTKLQNEQTDFAIEQVEQQKAQAQKDYIKEQSGAYKDWQKQSNKYGVQEEQEAAAGMSNTGYSESSQVSMYNTYQNRVSKSRESYNLAVQNYNNSITQARLQNNSKLAEIAYQALQKSLELSLQGFQYKNQLLLDQASKKLELEKMYQDRWLSVYDQIYKEDSLSEQIRQFNESLAEEQRQFDTLHPTSSGGGGGSSGGGGGRSGGSGGSGGLPKLKSDPEDDTPGDPSSLKQTIIDIMEMNSDEGTRKSYELKAVNAALKDGDISVSDAAKLKRQLANQQRVLP